MEKHKILTEGSQYEVRNSNPAPPVYEARTLTTQAIIHFSSELLTHSVSFAWFQWLTITRGSQGYLQTSLHIVNDGWFPFHRRQFAVLNSRLQGSRLSRVLRLVSSSLLEISKPATLES
jgi:hypothetical protein